MNSKAFHKISYGLYIVSSVNNDKINGQIANTVFQTTSDPATIAISINKSNLTHELIKSSKVFCVSILSKDTPMQLIGLFGFKTGRSTDKFKNINYKTGKTNSPIILDNTVAYLETEVIKSMDLTTHTLFIGKIIDTGTINERKEPMTYAYYHNVKNGRSPKNAPTYTDEKKVSKPKKTALKKYRCKICGYIYDPEKGDPDSGITPGTSFEEIPYDWTCPVCGAPKDDFEEYS